MDPAPHIVDQMSPEGNLTMEPKSCYIMELAVEKNVGKPLRDTKAAPTPTEGPIHINGTAASKHITGKGACSRRNMTGLQSPEILCLLKSERTKKSKT